MGCQCKTSLDSWVCAELVWMVLLALAFGLWCGSPYLLLRLRCLWGFFNLEPATEHTFIEHFLCAQQEMLER